jgi:hypothetical protein
MSICIRAGVDTRSRLEENIRPPTGPIVRTSNNRIGTGKAWFLISWEGI